MALETCISGSVICDKHDIILKRDKINNTFSLEFFCSNSNIDIKSIIDVGLYRVIAEINKDIIERIDIIENDDYSSITNLLFVFKRFGSEFGIAQKYMYLQTNRICREQDVYLQSKSIPYNLNIKGCELATSQLANLHVNLINSSSANIKYIFNIDFNEDLPFYMENLAGLLMKKIFIRLKTFIENIR